MTADIRHFGAVGDGQSPATAAIQEAIDACHESGGGTVLVPAGTYITGTIFLKSHVALHLSAGARLVGSTRREDYNEDDVFPENPVFSREDVTGAHLLIAYREHDVAITGEGTIDGNGAAFFESLPADEVTDSYQSMAPKFEVADWRPAQMVFFCRCQNVSVSGVSLVNSPYWTLFLLGCEGVHISRLHVSNPPQTRNGDGIDIDCCRDVTVSDCIVHSGDDALTLRAYSSLLGDEPQPCENVAISNCVLTSATCAIRVGVGSGTIRNCSICNMVVNETRTGINMISRYSESHTGVTIEDIHFSNFVMDTIVPINVLLGDAAQPPAAVRDISFSHIHATGRQGSYLGGNDEHTITGIRLHDVHLRMTGGMVAGDFENRKLRPVGTNDIPAGIWVQHVEDLRIWGLRVEWRKIEGPWRHAVIIEDGVDIMLSGIEAPAPPVESAREALHCGRVSDLSILPSPS